MWGMRCSSLTAFPWWVSQMLLTKSCCIYIWEYHTSLKNEQLHVSTWVDLRDVCKAEKQITENTLISSKTSKPNDVFIHIHTHGKTIKILREWQIQNSRLWHPGARGGRRVIRSGTSPGVPQWCGQCPAAEIVCGVLVVHFILLRNNLHATYVLLYIQLLHHNFLCKSLEEV